MAESEATPTDGATPAEAHGENAIGGAAAATDGLRGIDRLVDVELQLSVEIGTTRLPLRDVLQLGKGSIVELDRERGEPADLYVNGRRIARGEVTMVDDRLAVRVVELCDSDARERGR